MSLPKLTKEYKDFHELNAPMGLCYGPVQSRRLGKSLGINLLGETKICSFDCAYCELGQTQLRMNQLKQDGLFPTVAQIDEAVRERLRECINGGIKIDNLTISGNGEPTLHPDFDQCVEALRAIRSDLALNAPIVVLTNGAHLDLRRVASGLNSVDERMVKLDAGNEKLLKEVNNPLVRTNLSRLTSGSRKLKDVIVQSLFLSGAIDNTGQEDIDEWIEVIGIIKPKAVHLYTLDRVPPISGLARANEDTLYTIVSRLKRRLEIDCMVFS